jgi:hypothetical protein
VPKRGERVAPPPREGEWDLRYADNAAARGWEELSRAAPSALRAAWERLRSDPRSRSQRQHPLKAGLATRAIGGVPFEQWQYEVTGAGRLWYAIDEDQRIVWVTFASVGHPRQTN